MARMTALLTDNLPLLAGAPNGIKKLRELILELAVRGKLVPQDPSDEPASELLKHIAEEKSRLVAEGQVKKQKPLTDISEEEKPYDLPDSWAWVRLPEIYYPVSVSGNKLMSSQISEEGIFPVVDQGKRFIAGYTDDESLLIRLPGPVVVFGDHTTERKYVDFDFVAGADGVKILRPVLLDEKFFWWHLVGLKLEGRGYARHFKVLNDTFFALPPKSEQSRIAAKIDELMALCDRLEAKQADAESAHARMLQALLDSLTQVSDATDFAAGWQRLAEHFHTLFTTESSIDTLKQSLRQLAVMGKLVSQDSTCTELDGLPSGWRIQKIDEFCSVQGGIQKTPLRRPVSQHFPYLRVANVQRGCIDIKELERYELSLDELEKWRLNSGDLLIVEGNGSESEIGRCAIWYGEVKDCVYQNHLIRVRPKIAEEVGYLALYLNSPVGMAHMKRLAITTSGLFNLSVGKIRSIPVGLPPLAEQYRIVAKVDQLMTLCDQLKTRLTRARQLNEQLASTLVEQAVA